jgi:hypothetical protein
LAAKVRFSTLNSKGILDGGCWFFVIVDPVRRSIAVIEFSDPEPVTNEQ